MDITHESLHGQDIIILGPYRPWGYHKECGGDGGDYPTHSGRILDIKEAKPDGIGYFCNYLAPRLKTSSVVIAVPSHDPGKTTSGITLLADKLAAETDCLNGSHCLVRHIKIAKLSAGGDRSISVHTGSIAVTDKPFFQGKSVLLIDDVMTTGNSILACRKLLLDGGAAVVKCLALGRTTY